MAVLDAPCSAPHSAACAAAASSWFLSNAICVAAPALAMVLAASAASKYDLSAAPITTDDDMPTPCGPPPSPCRSCNLRPWAASLQKLPARGRPVRTRRPKGRRTPASQ
eukprot:5029300-Pyramimonas_sp.AAC.1